MEYFFSLSKSATETALDGSEILLIVSGLVLAFGAIGEYLEEHGRLPRWMKWPRLVFIVMVVVSLVGEFVGDGGVFLFSRHLQTISDSEIAGLNKEAGDARQEAGEAEERAGKAFERASNADERASANEREAAALRKRAEDEAMARVKIEDAVAWRRLNPVERSKLAARVAAFPKEPVGFIYNISDVESYGFATEIALALRATWTVLAEPLGIIKGREGPVPLGTNPPLERGVIVTSTRDRLSTEAADALSSALGALGFDSQRAPTDVRYSDMMHHRGAAVFVDVEPRPDGPQGAAKLRASKQ